MQHFSPVVPSESPPSNAEMNHTSNYLPSEPEISGRGAAICH